MDIKNTMTVGALRRQLKGLADDCPVYASFTAEPATEDAYMVNWAEFQHNTPISNAHFVVKIGKGFGW